MWASYVDFRLCFPLHKLMSVGQLHLVIINNLLPQSLVCFSFLCIKNSVLSSLICVGCIYLLELLFPVSFICIALSLLLFCIYISDSYLFLCCGLVLLQKLFWYLSLFFCFPAIGLHFIMSFKGIMSFNLLHVKWRRFEGIILVRDKHSVFPPDDL